MIKAIIFDLDGTICDTLTDLGECTNQALADFNLPPHKIEEYRKIVGNGVDTQMRRANWRRKIYQRACRSGQGSIQSIL